MYKTKYILGFTNDLDELYEIYFDFLNYEGDPTELTGTDDCLTIRSTAGDENKLEPILGTEALINIFVDENTPLGIADLIAEHDNDIRVTVYRDEDYSKSIFQGFIVVEDNSQPFQDRPYILSVRALDGLGLLKGVDLVDADSLRFVGSYSVLSWIAQILHKTGQQLKLRVYFNFIESSFMANVGALEQVFLNSITFSQGDAFNSQSTDPTVDINATTADDCYTALEKMVRCLRCRLFQEDGRWNLVSLYEYLNPDGFSFKEYSFGDPVDGIVPFTVVDSGLNQNYKVNVGKDQILHPINEDQNLYLKLATKWIKLSYTYDQSQNKICNQDFSEGDRNATYDEVISSSIIDASITPVVNFQTLGYDAFCWDTFDGSVFDTILIAAYPANPSTGKIFIREVIDELGYTKDRFLVIKNVLGGVPIMCRSQKMLADVNDILQVSFSLRLRNNEAGDSLTSCFIYLYGDDGSHWALNAIDDGTVIGNPTQWMPVDANFRNTPISNGSFFCSFHPGQAKSIFNSSSINTAHLQNQFFAKLPISGHIEFIFINSQEHGAGQEVWVKDLSITLLPYLTGTYQELKGDYNYSANTSDIKQTLSEDIEISDSPKRYFKGALLRPDGLSLATPTWKRVGKDESFRFAQLMERVMYNHLYRMVQKLEGTWRGLVYVPEDDVSVIRPNGYLCSYAFSDHDTPTKRFMLTSFEKDYTTGQWRGVFIETLKDQNADGFVLPDTYKFSYVFQ